QQEAGLCREHRQGRRQDRGPWRGPGAPAAVGPERCREPRTGGADRQARPAVSPGVPVRPPRRAAARISSETFMKKRILGALLCALPLASLAQAASWPEQQVTIVVPFPAGGSTDMVARAMALHMQNTLGKPFVVDNKPGATGTIGAGQV